MKNQVTEMFGIDMPIFAFTHCRDVVAAVTKAGGMGVLGAVGLSPRQLEIDLQWIEDEVGGKPYGVDLIVPAKYAGSDEGGMSVGSINQMIPDEHRAYLDQILEKYDVPPLEEGTTKSGGFNMKDDAAAPMSADSQMPNLEIALAFKPSLMVNALGPPPAVMTRPLPRSRHHGRRTRRQGTTRRAPRERWRRPDHRPGIRGRRTYR